jgi:excisionase family DNA binding protein
MSNRTNHGTSERLALSVVDVAELLNVSTRHIWTLHASGRMPSPFRLGRAVRWNRAELVSWLEAGCPTRHRWEAMKGAAR